MRPLFPSHWLVPAGIVLATCNVQAAAPQAGQIVILALQGGEGLRGLSVLLDGADIASTDSAGLVSVSAMPGAHQLELRRGNQTLHATTITLGGGEAAELVVRLDGGSPARAKLDVFSAADAGRGRYSGYVTDETGSPVAGAAVSLIGTDARGQTNAEGYFDLEAPRGVWDASVSHPKKSLTRTFSAQRVSTLLDGGVNLALSERRAAPTGAGIEEVVASARYVPDTASALERGSDSVLDAISSADIAIAGDSDAASALTRVTGVTIINDLVFVRGLGDRYSAAYVNRSEVPSPDPSRRAISLDLFPTDLIRGISVQKTYSADLPGDFSGGAVLIDTRGIPEGFNLSLGTSLGGNTRATGQDGLSYDGGSSDWLGNDDGTREIPSLAAKLTNGGRTPLLRLSQDEREAVGESLSNTWNVDVQKLRPDTGLSISVGDRFDRIALDERLTLGYQLAALHDIDNRFQREQRSELVSSSTGPSTIRTETLERSGEFVDTAMFASFGVLYDDAHSLEYSGFQTRKSLNGVFFSQGEETFGGDIDFREYTLDWVENDLLYQQLKGQHELSELDRLKLNWQASLTEAQSDVLDRRQYTLSRAIGTEDRFSTLTNGAVPRRSWEFLDERTADFDLNLDYSLALTEGFGLQLRGGARHTRRDRDYQLVRWNFIATNPARDLALALRNGNLENILTPELIRPLGGWVLGNASSLVPEGNADSYIAEHRIGAYYGAVKLIFEGQAELELGARQESSELGVGSRGNEGQIFGDAVLDTDDLLPAINGGWFFNERQQIRVGYSQTVNRPQFRELADVAYRDPESGLISFGNPNLRQAEIRNYDLRYEHYWQGAEGITAAVFLKQFDDPIEVQLRTNADGSARRTFGNAGQAEIYGIELDGRWELDELSRVSTFLGSSYISGNVSLIESEVDVSNDPTASRPKRPLQGQSPWIANLTLGYSNILTDTDVALLLNMFGERIVEAGFNGLPDAEEQPAPLLDLNIKQVFRGGWKLGFKLRNLLDPDIEVTQGSIQQRSYQLGRSYSLSLDYSF